jgi:hypothetical protein
MQKQIKKINLSGESNKVYIIPAIHVTARQIQLQITERSGV